MTEKINNSQEQIHQRFKHFGAKHLESRRKCVGLLPQIFRERIYEKKGFDSIFTYAAKLAGLSREQVRRALNVHAGFGNLPVLKNLFETGEVSINKLARIASVATTENEMDLANHVKVMSQKAIETFVKDLRLAETERASENTGRPDGFQKALFGDENVRAHNNTCEQSEHAYEQRGSNEDFIKQSGRRQEGNNQSDGNKIAHPARIIELKLSARNLEKLLALQNKGIDINEIIETALRKRDEGIARDKSEAAKTPDTLKPATRHIPAKTRKIIDAEQGKKCAVPGCSKPAQVIHHELPFAMLKTHDPNHLKKLCKAHHEIAHGINLKIYEIKKAAIDSG